MSATATALRENADHPVAVPTPVAPLPSAPAVPQRAKPKRSTLVLAGVFALSFVLVFLLQKPKASAELAAAAH
jgi:hypothetical protein